MKLQSLKVFFLSIMLAVATPAFAQQWKEGTHYNEIPFPLEVETGHKIEVREFFWYGCPHCYRLEPTVHEWLKHKPKDAEFVRSPAMLGPTWQLHALIYYTYEAMGIVDKMHQATFDAIHKEKRQLASVEDFADFVAEHGVDRKKFIRASNSFGVNLKMKHQLELDRDAGIHSVPTFVIDGKYRTDEGMAGDEKELVKLIDYLVAKAKKERKKK